ncbi:uncharacterized protein LOC107039716 [Diachasma alloeum]|uniref:uncharacterized protein LOC107039716 n=1 Tax=Diachasma alloeum TaxID=454923 RepID=UPI00073833E2|nr:uncharacterized protein LOC107039716 [Diachasma alloeum]
MISTLRKIKMEVGDILSYAVARNDGIQDLERFRGKSEPTWMFIENGKMVNLFFGANCPKFIKVLLAEVKRVQEGEEPSWSLPVGERGPEESVKYAREEKIRQSLMNKQLAKIEGEKRAIYEAYLYYMMCELSEETVLILYPWVFLDDAGYPKDKDKCPPYKELIYGLLPDRFDVLEQSRIQLTEDMVRNMLVETDIDITDDLIEGLVENKILAMRLKARPPPSDWPVPYPFKCPEDDKKCPMRAINDVENFLALILEEQPSGDNKEGEEALSYVERHKCAVSRNEGEEDEEEEEGREVVYPAVFYPPQARNKVHVFKTLFSAYLEKSHPYEEPVKLAPLCAFKFDSSQTKIVLDSYNQFLEVIEKFGVFEFNDWRARRIASAPEDFIDKIQTKTGNEMFLFVIRRVDEDTFLAFAGSNPLEIEEDEEKVNEILDFFFPEGAHDYNPDLVHVDDTYDEYFDAREEEEDYYDEEFMENHKFSIY